METPGTPSSPEQSTLVRAIALSTLCALGLVAGLFGLRYVITPQYAWTDTTHRVFVVPVGRTWAFGPLPNYNRAQWRFRVVAKEPVMVAIADAAKRDDILRGMSLDPGTAGIVCQQPGQIDVTLECTVPAEVRELVIAIRDERGSATTESALTAGAEAYLGAKEPLQQLTARNDVSLDVSARVCVRFCGGTTR